MALIVCPLCVREDDVVLVRTLPDGRKEARCDDCDFVFVYGSPTPEPKPAASRARTPRPRASAPARPSTVPIQVARQQFPSADDAPLEKVQHALLLKAQFLAEHPYTTDPVVASHWQKFRWVFSEDGLAKVVDYDLQSFVHDRTGGDVGSTAELDKAWLLMGELEGARRVRGIVTHLLRGSGEVEDRFTDLADGTGLGMTGFGEALLTKVLAVAEPYRVLPILTLDEKRAIAADVYGIDVPAAGVGSWTVGRLALFTNDLLVELAGDDFDDLFHVAAFLRWARTQ